LCPERFESDFRILQVGLPIARRGVTANQFVARLKNEVKTVAYDVLQERAVCDDPKSPAGSH
jgi:hypothetical protein